MADQAKKDRPKFAVVKLEEPLERGEEKIAELKLRRPDAGSLRGISLADLLRMETGAVAKLLPRISTPSLVDAEVDSLDPADLLAISVEVASFFMTREELAAFPTT
jgi:hypothetical protein